MASLNNYPSYTTLNNAELWSLMYFGGNALTDSSAIGYVPDTRASIFAQYERVTENNVTFWKGTIDDIYFKLVWDSSNYIATMGWYNVSDDSLFATYQARTTGTNITSFSTVDNVNFYTILNNDGTVDKIGIMFRGIGYDADHNFITNYFCSSPFISSIADKIKPYITVENAFAWFSPPQKEITLNESNDFKLSDFGSAVASMDVQSFPSTTTIPLQANMIKWRDNQYYNTWRYTSGNYYQGQDISSIQLVYDFASSDSFVIGSDLLRKTGDDKFYNGIDLAYSYNADVNHLVSGLNSSYPGYTIDFEGGRICLYTNGTQRIRIENTDGTKYDECKYAKWGEFGKTNYTDYRYRVCDLLYLSKSGGSYYLVGFCRAYRFKDENGVEQPSDPYYRTGAFYILHKFNEEISEVLNNSTTEKYITDPENIDEKEVETGDNQIDNYDRSSTWGEGEWEDTNKGIRYNGENIIDSRDPEIYHDDSVSGISPPTETGTGASPTPLNTGMIGVFAPSISQMLDFASELSATTFLDAMKIYLSNPMDIIISAHTCIAPDLTASANNYYLTYGAWKSTHSLPMLTQMQYEVDMGSVTLPELTNSYRDYSPVTKLSIYLPFIGVKQLDVDYLMGLTLKLKYIINVLSGDITAELRVLNNYSQHENPYYTWVGNTMSKFPLTAYDYNAMIGAITSGVLSLGGIAMGVASGNPASMLSAGGSAINSISNIAHNMKPHFTTLGSYTGNVTHNFGATAYLIREVPIKQTFLYQPENYDRLCGKPSITGMNLIGTLAAGSIGAQKYISFTEVDVDGLSCTQEEKQLIVDALKGGVYI